MSAHRRVRMLNPAGSGASACEPRPLDDETVECVRTMASRMNWSGMFMVELLRDGEGTPWFVEWNGRAWGSLALSRRRGLEYPAWTIEAALGREPGFVEPDERGSFLCRNLGRELLHLLHVLRGPRGDDLHEWPSRLGTLRDLLRFKRTDRWYNLEDGDWWFFLRESAHNVRTHLRKARWS